MANIEYRDGLLFTSVEIFEGNQLQAAETIIPPDVVEEIDIFAELDDYVHSFYGVGCSLHNFFSNQVEEVNLGKQPALTLEKK